MKTTFLLLAFGLCCTLFATPQNLASSENWKTEFTEAVQKSFHEAYTHAKQQRLKDETQKSFDKSYNDLQN